MVLRVVGDVGGFGRGGILAALNSETRLVHLELEGVEGDGLDGLLDLEGDVDGALVGPGLAGLDVGDGDGVVGGLDAGDGVRYLRINTGTVLLLLIRQHVSVRSHLDQ